MLTLSGWRTWSIIIKSMVASRWSGRMHNLKCFYIILTEAKILGVYNMETRKPGGILLHHTVVFMCYHLFFSWKFRGKYLVIVITRHLQNALLMSCLEVLVKFIIPFYRFSDPMYNFFFLCLKPQLDWSISQSHMLCLSLNVCLLMSLSPKLSAVEPHDAQEMHAFSVQTNCLISSSHVLALNSFCIELSSSFFFS